MGHAATMWKVRNA